MLITLLLRYGNIKELLPAAFVDKLLMEHRHVICEQEKVTTIAKDTQRTLCECCLVLLVVVEMVAIYDRLY